MTTTDDALAFEESPRPWWLLLLEGIAALIIGVLLLTTDNTAELVVFMVQLLGLYWLIKGIFNIIAIFIDSTAWGWKLFIGVIGILAGILVLQHPIWSGILVPVTLVLVLGIYGIIAGIIELIMAFQGGGWGVDILGAISILLGIIILGNRFLVTLSLPFWGGLTLAILGILAIVQAFRER